MNNRALMSLSLSALMLGGSMVGCSQGGAIASASSHDAVANDAQAAVDAGKASKALAKSKPAAAIGFAEAAVALSPRSADYRVLLGQSYLKAGRFTSARAAFADALTLAPDNGKAALNLALVQVGLGEWDAARTTLEDHAGTIPVADRGLAVALAGDPASAVDLLTAAVRASGGDVKARQNLALTLALAGRWPEARAVAAMDLSPADVDRRLEQWAAFAHPSSASDQVAALLGVVPVVDAGQPTALALAAPTPVAPKAAEPVKTAEAAPVAEPVTVAAAAPAPQAVPLPTAATQFAAATPVVQPLPSSGAAPVIAARGPFKMAAAAVPSPAKAVVAEAKGEWFVQFGAYESAGVAKDGWARALRRAPMLKGHVPNGVAFQVKGASYYRLSAGGFTRGDAVSMCRSFKRQGGDCFVRAGAGDQVASWVNKRVQLASR